VDRAGISIMSIAYCDKIAQECLNQLVRSKYSNIDCDMLITDVGPICSDLDPVGGWFISTKKTIKVTDFNGQNYTVTIEVD
jgi:hypothetical protein